MTYLPDASVEARRLITQLGVRLLEAERSGRYKDSTKPGAALTEMDEASAPLREYVGAVEARVKQLESWGVGGARERRPFPPERTPEPDETERASEPPTGDQPDEEAPETHDFADPAGGFAARRL